MEWNWSGHINICRDEIATFINEPAASLLQEKARYIAGQI
jgi:hypothetical protein